jgi:hypothetical protein
MSKSVDAQAVRRLTAQLFRVRLSQKRAAQISDELARLNEAAGVEGNRNDFNDQPMNFALVLAGLAKR